MKKQINLYFILFFHIAISKSYCQEVSNDSIIRLVNTYSDKNALLKNHPQLVRDMGGSIQLNGNKIKFFGSNGKVQKKINFELNPEKWNGENQKIYYKTICRGNYLIKETYELYHEKTRRIKQEVYDSNNILLTSIDSSLNSFEISSDGNLIIGYEDGEMAATYFVVFDSTFNILNKITINFDQGIEIKFIDEKGTIAIIAREKMTIGVCNFLDNKVERMFSYSNRRAGFFQNFYYLEASSEYLLSYEDSVIIVDNNFLEKESFKSDRLLRVISSKHKNKYLFITKEKGSKELCKEKMLVYSRQENKLTEIIKDVDFVSEIENTIFLLNKLKEIIEYEKI